MASILLVLVATIGAINIYNYISVKNEVNNSLTMVIDNGLIDLGPGEGGGPIGPGGEVQREHYFIVSYNQDGSVNQSSFKHIFIISEADGLKMASEVYNGNKADGRNDNLFYKKTTKDNLTYVAFVDAKERLDSFHNFLVSSSVIATISYALIFVLIFFSSKIVFRVSEESYRKQKAFITNASHELKTPLTVISTDIELIEMDNGKSEWSSSIKDQVDRLTKMTNQLVILSRLDEEDLSKFPFEEFSLSSLANNCVDTFSPSFKKEELNLDVDIKENISINANKFLIEELFFIFMDNALKYAYKEVGVSLEKDKKDRVLLTFYNDVSEDYEVDTNLLFERFYRSPNTSKKGSGIGLSIAKEIINLHKGNIKVSKENNILKFIITF